MGRAGLTGPVGAHTTSRFAHPYAWVRRVRPGMTSSNRLIRAGGARRHPAGRGRLRTNGGGAVVAVGVAVGVLGTSGVTAGGDRMGVTDEGDGWG
ncbi:hypothetical protein Srut_16240 [Streptomyces rutgersensis]|nr:hypothetical protein Srut_16240 [Streptomyces rutgersensis]